MFDALQGRRKTGKWKVEKGSPGLSAFTESQLQFPRLWRLTQRNPESVSIQLSKESVSVHHSTEPIVALEPGVGPLEPRSSELAGRSLGQVWSRPRTMSIAETWRGTSEARFMRLEMKTPSTAVNTGSLIRAVRFDVKMCVGSIGTDQDGSGLQGRVDRRIITGLPRLSSGQRTVAHENDHSAPVVHQLSAPLQLLAPLRAAVDVARRFGSQRNGWGLAHVERAAILCALSIVLIISFACQAGAGGFCCSAATHNSATGDRPPREASPNVSPHTAPKKNVLVSHSKAQLLNYALSSKKVGGAGKNSNDAGRMSPKDPPLPHPAASSHDRASTKLLPASSKPTAQRMAGFGPRPLASDQPHNRRVYLRMPMRSQRKTGNLASSGRALPCWTGHGVAVAPSASRTSRK
ncbi:hypothetical protein BDK51DRAFT_37151 [Blyttiomyces helicus]|uniref:Uncharacterized protein n=1 Tax=Blyttiomyces helicus TaxID=388810 RepID=A0A4P9WDP4_9FUNG|nr:hypothetical protein BDK51DRAFT_37151 [Blyttiomyces helicus]|eukprot:RKO89855.1 hypothetical protein BDK51DRAFT_37151 [Blyttiomyces helicus]